MSSVIPAPTVGHMPHWTLADRLRKARENAGLEQSELSRVSGISRATISAAENGHRRPSRSVIAMWAMATGVSRNWLTGEEPSPDDDDRGIRQEKLDQLRLSAILSVITARTIEGSRGHEDAAAVLAAVGRRENEVQEAGNWEATSKIDHPEVMDWCARNRRDLYDRIVQIQELPDLDSNQEPAGSTLAPVFHLDDHRRAAAAPDAHEAVVTPIRRGVGA